MRIQPHAKGRVVAAVILGTIVSGCATAQLGTNSNNDVHPSYGSRYSLLSSGAPNASSVPNEFLFNPSPNGTYGNPDLNADHPRVEAFVLDYETRSHGFFERALDRSRRYIARMTAILREEGVPQELAYLPLIESGFNPHAVSPAGAVGPWQFISETGRRYGLRIDRYVDERRDPDKSTRAAAQYLKDLYSMFGDWPLSLAAYNTGEERVAKTMDREGTDSYWEMMENRDLHRETCDYVPRFLAALTIAEAPEEHGFDAVEPAPLEDELVAVDRSVSLRTIAELAGASETQIKDLNPALVRGVTPPDSTGYPVHVPVGTKDQFELAYARMLQEASDVEAQPELVAETYRVHRGDTLASIAQREGVSPQALLRANGLKSSKQVKVGRLLRLPGPSGTAIAHSGRAGRAASTARASSAPSSYRVQRGESVASVAKRFGVSEQDLLHANGLKSAKTLKAGAKLHVPQNHKAAPVAVAKASRHHRAQAAD